MRKVLLVAIAAAGGLGASPAAAQFGLYTGPAAYYDPDGLYYAGGTYVRPPAYRYYGAYGYAPSAVYAPTYGYYDGYGVYAAVPYQNAMKRRYYGGPKWDW